MEGNYNEYWRRLGYEQEMSNHTKTENNINWREVAEHWQKVAEMAIQRLNELETIQHKGREYEV